MIFSLLHIDATLFDLTWPISAKQVPLSNCVYAHAYVRKPSFASEFCESCRYIFDRPRGICLPRVSLSMHYTLLRRFTTGTTWQVNGLPLWIIKLKIMSMNSCCAGVPLPLEIMSKSMSVSEQMLEIYSLLFSFEFSIVLLWRWLDVKI